MDLRAYMAERSPLVEAFLESCLPPANRPPEALHGAMRHLVFPGGKRLRPLLAMASAEAVGGSAEQSLPAAAAVELIHTYSLIHDDLPCMDDDAERRGRPSVHVAFGEAVAVLAGDALQALAFEVLARAADTHSPALAAAAALDLARAVGAEGLVGGQVDDLAFDPATLSNERVESVHERKSAALISAAIVGGARLAGGSDAQLAELARFGFEIGVAFQIADDLLDEGEDDPCSSLTVLGREGAEKRAEWLLTRALDRVESLGSPAEVLRELARFSVRRDT
ncbi:MAG: polyprenyl synthetase family protein [Myxococcota bacterium]|nr:polyprenyl synthetase family protein [Myxococcota bacterium]